MQLNELAGTRWAGSERTMKASYQIVERVCRKLGGVSRTGIFCKGCLRRWSSVSLERVSRSSTT